MHWWEVVGTLSSFISACPFVFNSIVTYTMAVEHVGVVVSDNVHNKPYDRRVSSWLAFIIWCLTFWPIKPIITLHQVQVPLL